MAPQKGNRIIARVREEARAEEAEAAAQVQAVDGDALSDEWDTAQSTDVDLDEDGVKAKFPAGQEEPDAQAQDPLSRDEMALVAYYKSASDKMQTLMQVMVRRLPGASRRSVKFVKDHHPALDMDACREIVRGLEPRDDEGWTADDERALRDEWENDPLRDELWKLETGKNKDVLPMWKVVTGSLSCFPTSVISARNHLKYHVTFETDDGQHLEQPNWTKTFCRRFTSLALHGIFQGQPSLLVLSLLYVAICRTDYRGAIPWQNSTTDGFLDLLLEGMRDQDGSMSVVQVHREIRRRLKHEGKIVPLISALFVRVEKAGFEEREDDDVYRPDEPPVFTVSPADLSLLTRSIDSVKHLGVWVFLPVSFSTRLMKLARRSLDEPKSLRHLNELREDVILNDRRRGIIDARRPPSQESSSPTPPPPNPLSSPSPRYGNPRSKEGEGASSRPRLEDPKQDQDVDDAPQHDAYDPLDDDYPENFGYGGFGDDSFEPEGGPEPENPHPELTGEPSPSSSNAGLNTKRKRAESPGPAQKRRRPEDEKGLKFTRTLGKLVRRSHRPNAQACRSLPDNRPPPPAKGSLPCLPPVLLLMEDTRESIVGLNDVPPHLRVGRNLGFASPWGPALSKWQNPPLIESDSDLEDGDEDDDEEYEDEEGDMKA